MHDVSFYNQGFTIHDVSCYNQGFTIHEVSCYNQGFTMHDVSDGIGDLVSMFYKSTWPR